MSRTPRPAGSDCAPQLSPRDLLKLKRWISFTVEFPHACVHVLRQSSDGIARRGHLQWVPPSAGITTVIPFFRDEPPA